MGLKVLLIEDNPATRYMIQVMLESKGHKLVAEALDLSEAIRAYGTHKPDVVILDLALAKEDGLTILKAIRKLDKRAKVLIASVNAQKKIRDQVIAAGASGYLNKPFRMEDLLSSVEGLA